MVVARYEPVEFTLRVRNNGTSELKDVRFAVKVNGDENKRPVGVDPDAAGEPGAGGQVRADLRPGRQTDEKPLDRFSLVTASLASGEPGGIAADNVRHAVVEVRERLPILVARGPSASEREGRTTGSTCGRCSPASSAGTAGRTATPATWSSAT